MDYFLGVDMGGTNLRFAVVSADGKIIWSDRISTQAGSPRDEILAAMKVGIREGLNFGEKKGKRPQGLGIGVPGTVDFENGFIQTLVNVPGWDRVPLGKILEEEFKLPVFVDNDVNVMALGEHAFGAARKARNIICVTLGTGVGGGVIVDGALYRGSTFSAGELGHIVVQRDGPLCNCGNRGCLERFIGNRYLMDRALELYRMKAPQKIPKMLLPEDLDKAAAAGDEVARFVWEEVATHLGIVLAGLVNFFNPDLIVIGGGIAKAGRFLFDPLGFVVKERSMAIPGRHVQVVPAELGTDAGLIGAAALVMRKSGG